MYKISNKLELESFILKSWDDINKYICEVSKNLPVPIYSSVDVRESKTKFAPVDHNMYPAGFNNICKLDLKKCSEKLKETITKTKTDTKIVGILPESHTKNLFYLEHLYTLKQTIEDAGFQVIILTFDQALINNTSSIKLESQSGKPLEIFPAKINQTKIEANNLTMDLVILNHDQSNPIEINWHEIATPICPTPFIGWYRRSKVTHFQNYQKVANSFCEHFSIDPDLIQAKFKTATNIDFETKDGLENIAKEVDLLISELPSNSKVFVKAAQGTYGMGISVVSSGEEIINMNRKVRNKMDVGKNNIKFTSVLIQEGIETVVKFDDVPAEVTIYLISGKALGGFIRANPLRSTTENLNAKGMVYQKLCLSDICCESEHKNKEAVYSIIARLATVASAYEIKNVI